MKSERAANEALRATYTRENRPAWLKPAPIRTRPTLVQRILRRITQR